MTTALAGATPCSLLTAQMKILLEPLRRGSPVPVERLVSVLYGSRWDGGPDNAHTIVHIQVSRMRRRLARYGIRLLTVGPRGAQGYMVDPAHLPRLDALLTGARNSSGRHGARSGLRVSGWPQVV